MLPPSNHLHHPLSIEHPVHQSPPTNCEEHNTSNCRHIRFLVTYAFHSSKIWSEISYVSKVALHSLSHGLQPCRKTNFLFFIVVLNWWDSTCSGHKLARNELISKILPSAMEVSNGIMSNNERESKKIRSSTRSPPFSLSTTSHWLRRFGFSTTHERTRSLLMARKNKCCVQQESVLQEYLFKLEPRCHGWIQMTKDAGCSFRVRCYCLDSFLWMGVKVIVHQERWAWHKLRPNDLPIVC